MYVELWEYKKEEKQGKMTTFFMETKHGKPLKLTKWTEDILMPEFIPGNESFLNEVAELDHRAGDVLVCSYPKSGTHWMQALLRTIKYVVGEVEESEVDAFMNERLGILESAMNVEHVKAAVSPRIMITHLRPTRIPNYFREGKAKVVFILRNPKDVVVSFYHQLKDAKNIRNKQDWDEFFASFYSGICPFGQYLDHLKAWEVMLKDNKKMDIEIFYYEELKTNGLENVRRLVQHIGYDLDDAELQQVLEKCSIKSLKEQDNTVIKAMENDRKDLIADKDGKSVIYRKGEIGDWKNQFTVAQNEMYDELLKNKLADSMFKIRFE